MQDVTIHSVECVCPSRHRIFAATFDEPPADKEKARQFVRTAVQGAIDAKLIEPWCKLCHAPASSWRYLVDSYIGPTEDRRGLQRKNWSHQTMQDEIGVFVRKVVSVEAVDGATDVTLGCGHVIRALRYQPCTSMPCAQCVNRYMDAQPALEAQGALFNSKPEAF